MPDFSPIADTTIDSLLSISCELEGLQILNSFDTQSSEKALSYLPVCNLIPSPELIESSDSPVETINSPEKPHLHQGSIQYRAAIEAELLPADGLEQLPKGAKLTTENTAHTPAGAIKEGTSITWTRICDRWRPAETIFSNGVTCTYRYNAAGEIQESVTRDSAGIALRVISREGKFLRLYVSQGLGEALFEADADSLSLRKDGTWKLRKDNSDEKGVELNSRGEIITDRQIDAATTIKRIDSSTTNSRTYTQHSDGHYRLTRQMLPDGPKPDGPKVEYSYTDTGAGGRGADDPDDKAEAGGKQEIALTGVIWSHANTRISFDWQPDEKCWRASGLYMGKRFTDQQGELILNEKNLPEFKAYGDVDLDLSLERLSQRPADRQRILELQSTLLSMKPAFIELDLIEKKKQIDDEYVVKLREHPQDKVKLDDEKVRAIKAAETESEMQMQAFKNALHQESAILESMDRSASNEQIWTAMPITREEAKRLAGWIESALPTAWQAYQKVSVSEEPPTIGDNQSADRLLLTSLSLLRLSQDSKSPKLLLGIDFSKPLSDQSVETIVKAFKWSDAVIRQHRKLAMRQAFDEVVPGMMRELRMSEAFIKATTSNTADDATLFTLHHLTQLYSTADHLMAYKDLRHDKVQHDLFNGDNPIRKPPGWNERTQQIDFPENLCLSDPKLQRFISDLADWIEREGPEIRKRTEELTRVTDRTIVHQIHYGDVIGELHATFHPTTGALLEIHEKPVADSKKINLLSGDYSVEKVADSYFIKINWAAKDSGLINLLDILAPTVNKAKSEYIHYDGQPKAYRPADPVIYINSQGKPEVVPAYKLSSVRSKQVMEYYWSKTSTAFLDASMALSGLFSGGSLLMAGAGLRSLILPAARSGIGLSGFLLNGAYASSTETGRQLQSVRHTAMAIDVLKNFVVGRSAFSSRIERLGSDALLKSGAWYGSAARRYNSIRESRSYKVLDTAISADYINTFLARRPGAEGIMNDAARKKVEEARLDAPILPSVSRQSQMYKLDLLDIFQYQTNRLASFSDDAKVRITRLRSNMRELLTIPPEISDSTLKVQKRWQEQNEASKSSLKEQLVGRIYGENRQSGNSREGDELRFLDATAVYLLSLNESGEPPADGVLSRSETGAVLFRVEDYFKMLQRFAAQDQPGLSIAAADMLVRAGQRPEFFLAATLKNVIANPRTKDTEKAVAITELCSVMKRLERFEHDVLPGLNSATSLNYLSQGVGVRAHELFKFLGDICQDKDLSDDLRILTACTLHLSDVANSERQLFQDLRKLSAAFADSADEKRSFAQSKMAMLKNSMNLDERAEVRLSAIEALLSLKELGPFQGEGGRVRLNQAIFKIIIPFKVDGVPEEDITISSAIALLQLGPGDGLTLRQKNELSSLLSIQSKTPENIKAALAKQAFNLITGDDSRNFIVRSLIGAIALDSEESAQTRAKSADLRKAAVLSLQQINNAYPDESIKFAILRLADPPQAQSTSAVEDDATVRKAAISAISCMVQTTTVRETLERSAKNDPNLAVRDASQNVRWSHFVYFEDEEKRLEAELATLEHVNARRYSYEQEGKNHLKGIDLPPQYVLVRRHYFDGRPEYADTPIRSSAPSFPSKNDTSAKAPYKEKAPFAKDDRDNHLDWEGPRPTPTPKEEVRTVIEKNPDRRKCLDENLFRAAVDINNPKKFHALGALACLLRNVDLRDNCEFLKPRKGDIPDLKGGFFTELTGICLQLRTGQEREVVQDKALNVLCQIAANKHSSDRELFVIQTIISDSAVHPRIRLQLLRALDNRVREELGKGTDGFDKRLAYGAFIVDALNQELKSPNQTNPKEWTDSSTELRTQLLESIQFFKPISGYITLRSMELGLLLEPDDPIALRAKNILADMRYSVLKRLESMSTPEKVPGLDPSRSQSVLAASMLAAVHSRDTKDSIIAVDTIIAAIRYSPLRERKDPRIDPILAALTNRQSQSKSKGSKQLEGVAKSDRDMVRLAAAMAVLEKGNTAFSADDRMVAARTAAELWFTGQEHGHRRDARAILQTAIEAHKQTVFDALVDYALSEQPKRAETWAVIENLLEQYNAPEIIFRRREDGTAILLKRGEKGWTAAEFQNGRLRSSYRAPAETPVHKIVSNAVYGVVDPQFRLDWAQQMLSNGASSSSDVENTLYVLNGLAEYSKNSAIRVKACKLIVDAAYAEKKSDRELKAIESRFGRTATLALIDLVLDGNLDAQRILMGLPPLVRKDVCEFLLRPMSLPSLTNRDSSNDNVPELSNLCMDQLQDELTRQLELLTKDENVRLAYRKNVEMALKNMSDSNSQRKFLQHTIEQLRRDSARKQAASETNKVPGKEATALEKAPNSLRDVNLENNERLVRWRKLIAALESK